MIFAVTAKEKNRGEIMKFIWTSVKDKMPEKQGYYLGYTSTGNMYVVKLCMCGRLDEDGSVTYGNKPEFTIPITHWAELPEAPGRY